MEEIQKIKEEINNTKNDILKQYKYINEKYKLICEDNEEKISLYTQITNTKIDIEKQLQDLKENIEDTKSEANEKLEAIQETYDLICGEDNNEALYTQITNTKIDIEKQLQDLSNKINSFNKFYDEAFGELEGEGNARNAGLRKELQDLKKQFQDYIETQKKAFESYEKEKKSKFAEIEKDIKKLLGGATNGSLAHSYEISKKSYRWPIVIWNILTMGSILCIAYTSYASFKDIKLNDYMSILSLVALRLPIYIPLVWLGIFSTRRRNEIKRLQEEYKHKETIAKTYYGYQEQMAKLSDSEKAKELQERLMSNLVDMINQNPNTTLDKIKQENAPMIDLIEKFSKLPKDGQDMIKDMINKINIGAK